jgi:hypothetical protein
MVKIAHILHIKPDKSVFSVGLSEVAARFYANLFHVCEIIIAFHEKY